VGYLSFFAIVNIHIQRTTQDSASQFFTEDAILTKTTRNKNQPIPSHCNQLPSYQLNYLKMAALSECGPLFSMCGCWQVGAAGALARASPEVIKSSNELSEASNEGYTKGTLALQYTKDVADLLQGFQGGGGGIYVNTFAQIKELIEQKKARKAYALAKEMDDVALNMTTKANHTTKILNDVAHEVIPENVREDMEGATDPNIKTRGGPGGTGGDNNMMVEDEEASALVELLGHGDSDVEEVHSNTRSMEQVDVFTAGSTGHDAFSKVANKENVAVKIFKEIKSVADAIGRTLAVVAGDGSSLCTRFMGAMSGVDALFKALRLSKLIEKALDTVRRILEAFMGFINTSWDKFQKFIDQFDAGKKLEKFADGMKNKLGKIGKVFG